MLANLMKEIFFCLETEASAEAWIQKADFEFCLQNGTHSSPSYSMERILQLPSSF